MPLQPIYTFTPADLRAIRHYQRDVEKCYEVIARQQGLTDGQVTVLPDGSGFGIPAEVEAPVPIRPEVLPTTDR